jgi:hypothetical protein
VVERDRVDRTPAVTVSTADRILGVIDAGLQSTTEDSYGTDHLPDRCARCQRHEPGVGDLCTGCRAFLLEDSDDDPAALPRMGLRLSGDGLGPDGRGGIWRIHAPQVRPPVDPVENIAAALTYMAHRYGGPPQSEFRRYILDRECEAYIEQRIRERNQAPFSSITAV